MFKDKLKKLIGNHTGETKGKDNKKIENLVFFVILLIITVVIINFIWNGKKQTNKSNTNTASKQLASNQDNASDTNTGIQTNEMEQSLESILSKIHGVGDVKVFIHYSQSSEVVPMYNENSKVSTTEETDTSGGIRKVQETDSQKDIVYQENNGEKVAITQKVIEPKIEGAIITAKGAANASIKTSIIQAVEAVTGLATHKIQVFEMQS